MMKNWCFFIIFFFSNFSAQNDKVHWFAPVFDGQKSERVYYMLTLSTAETSPFNVVVQNGTKTLFNKKISHNIPLILYLDKNDISTTSKKDILKVLKKGLFVRGDKKFVAQLRILTTDDFIGLPIDGEIITSKGREALGQDFMIGNIPNTIDESDINFQASIIATEDNTKVKFLNINPNLRFFKSSSILSQEIILNKGESFIVAGSASDGKQNLQGLLGAEITSDKPISVTNGHFNGQYFLKLYQQQSDILLDQSIPIEKLGNEYIIVKGLSPIISSMGEVLIIATEDNTVITVNSKTNQKIKINKGEFYILDKLDFENNAIYLLGNKNFYAYQFFGAGQIPFKAFASGGMILIPPLDCYFSRKIETIAYPDELYSNYFTTKLNIITKKDAQIKFNGQNLNPSILPNIISGNDEWVYYILPEITGEINSVTSTRGMYVELIGGNNAVGYGASYSGFSKEPEILISANKTCIPGVELSVDDDFDFYQWQLNDQDILGATEATYKPLQQGSYSCKVSNDGCFVIELPKVYIFNCNNTIDLNYDICSILKIDLAQIHSGFDLSTFEILKNPDYGNVEKKGNILTYQLTDLAKKSDNFQYKICDYLGVCYKVNVSLNIKGSFTDENSSQYFLCKDEEFATLELNEIYDSYEWSTGEKTSTIKAGIGEFYVDLTKDNCTSRQSFSVKPTQSFAIINIKVLQDKSIIYTSDDTKNYLYSLDGITFQTSNEFDNLKSGSYKVYVKFADSNCEIVEGNFVIFNVPNFISPNSDGINDIIDFSAFKDKNEVKLDVFNKYGKSVYKGEKELIWNGKLNNRKLPTSTYWYILTFKDDLTSETTVYKGWILLRNR